MAFTREQIEDFIAALHEDAELRERVRGAILADDFQALPGLVRANTEAIAALTERMDALTERIDAFIAASEVRFQRLEKRMDDTVGKLGNLEGGFLEIQYPKRAFSRLAPQFTAINVLSGRDLADRLDKHGNLDAAELEDIFLLDCVVEARRRDNREPATFAIEVSKTVAESDVVRAARRAEILRKAGFENVEAGE